MAQEAGQIVRHDFSDDEENESPPLSRGNSRTHLVSSNGDPSSCHASTVRERLGDAKEPAGRMKVPSRAIPSSASEGPTGSRKVAQTGVIVRDDFSSDSDELPVGPRDPNGTCPATFQRGRDQKGRMRQSPDITLRPRPPFIRGSGCAFDVGSSVV